MTKVNRDLLSTYLSLNTPKADAYLAKIASNIRERVAAATSNDEILEELEILKEFVYKVPKPTIEIVRLAMTKNFAPQPIETQFGTYEGKGRQDVLGECIGLLGQIRYIDPDGVLPVVADFIRLEGGALQEKARTTLTQFAKYDFNVLTKTPLGYGPQRKALDFILAWSDEERLVNLDFVVTVAESLLEPSLEGTTADSVDTITLHSGALQPTEDLKRLRRQTIDLISELYRLVGVPQMQLRLVKVLGEALRTPSTGLYGDDLAQMISGDGVYLLGVFRSMLFGEGGRLDADLAIALEIDKLLYWFQRHETLKIAEAERLRSDLLENSLYSVARVLVGEDLMLLEEAEWSDAERRLSEKLAELVNEVTETSAHSWYETLNAIAGERGLIEEWQFRRFHDFLRSLAAEKSEIAFRFLVDSLGERPLASFATPILSGLRDGARVDLWDTVVERIATLADVLAVGSICYSISVGPQADQGAMIREQDILLLEDIARTRGRFAFLGSVDGGGRAIHYAVRSALLANIKRDPRRLEPLLFEEAARDPTHRGLLIRELGFAAHRKWIDVANLSDVSIALLQDWFVELPALDWHDQEVLNALGARDMGLVMDVFLARIERDVEIKRENKTLDAGTRYEAIPYHFNERLKASLARYPHYRQRISVWLEKLTGKWSLYNWNVGHFLDRVGLSSRDILMSIVERGDDVSLAKAIALLDTTKPVDVSLCMEIVKRTDNEKILGQVGSLLFATGVMAGEDGIARAYEARAAELKQYAAEKDARLRRYARRMTKVFREGAARERARVAEERQIRKNEFDG
jgi:hypothetical protein